jgi:Cytochrome c3
LTQGGTMKSAVQGTARRAGALLALCLSVGVAALAAAPTSTAAAKATAAKVAEMTAEQRAVHDRIGQAKQGVAGLHRGKSGMPCGKCHAEKVAVAPDDNQTVENRECIACHEDYAVLAAETAKKLSNKAINPHASHLGPEIACTSCHQGHQESKAYCLNCHTNFVMPMPGNSPAAR